MSYSKEEQITIIKNGYQLLYDEKKYNQADVVTKLGQVKCKTNRTAHSRILNQKYDDLTDALVQRIFDGYKQLMEIELAHKLNKKGKWVRDRNVNPTEILIKDIAQIKSGRQVYSKGRLDVSKKIKFFSVASKEVIEFGLTLNTFSSYLNNMNENGFRESIVNLLKKGVKVKCYLMDPEWNGTKMYFNDRESVIREEQPGTNKIRVSINRLKIFYSEIKNKKYCENFEVYTYKHIPSNYCLLIDGSINANAKMMVSNYLFGQPRKKCPVLSVSRAEDAPLFLIYLESLQKIITKAIRVNLNESLN